MINRILANFLFCLENEDLLTVFHGRLPDGYQWAILNLADVPDWISLGHWKRAFGIEDPRNIDLRIIELHKHQNMLFEQIICADDAHISKIEDALTQCTTEIEIAIHEQKLLQDVLYLRTHDPELADAIWSVIQDTT